MKSYVYHSATATAHALIEHLIAMMEREPEKTFYFAFSGGSTPSLMFDIWANEYKEVTPWMRMRIYWVDERCVPAEDYESNYGTMRRLLLDEVGNIESRRAPIAADFIRFFFIFSLVYLVSNICSVPISYRRNFVSIG